MVFLYDLKENHRRRQQQSSRMAANDLFDRPSIIIDNGSYNIKAGFSCDNHPLSIFRSVVGRPNYLHGSYGREPYEVYFGDEALDYSDQLEFNYPIKEGRVVHWDNMERIWHHVYYKELKVAPEERPLLLACSTSTPMNEKIKYCEVLFESLFTPAICVQFQSMLALYGSGVTTGMCVDMGYATTDISPGYEGGVISYALMRPDIAGEQVNKYVEDCLYKKGFNFGDETQLIAEDILRKCLYVSPTIDNVAKQTKHYILPSGEKIDVTEEMFVAGESFFKPNLIPSYMITMHNEEITPLQSAIVTAGLKCDSELRMELYEAVALCGGFGQIPGLAERLEAEIQKDGNVKATVITSTEAYGVAWLGGATFADLPGVQEIWVTKTQYEESGEKVMRNKFI